MADETRSQSDTSRPDDYVKGGKGPKDEVGGSGIYPAPGDAEIRSEGELARHGGPRSKPTDEQESKKSDLSSGSE
jgi:hypothetical protein